ncbi:hypothetical protein [Methylobacterium tardum]|uniref:hypothetical protein n=1 Tax=Methylobacterium tardum TaxID=374432 RepID=UPI001EE0B022|nr:hypothetical protein [Methylobacterium tardum]URD36778.1 hypothetical protein M6G65_31450 [Methylobacterium tardum]
MRGHPCARSKTIQGCRKLTVVALPWALRSARDDGALQEIGRKLFDQDKNKNMIYPEEIPCLPSATGF